MGISTGNSVDTKHPSWYAREYEMRQLRDCVEGMTKIKGSGPLYLPVPTAMIAQNELAAGQPDDSGNYNEYYNSRAYLEARAPWQWYGNAPYSAYLQRARFPNIVAATLRGLVGIATKREPEVELPSQMEYLVDDASKDGMGLFDFYEKCLFEVLAMGRYSIVVDVCEDGALRFITYNTESFINWKDDHKGTYLAVFNEHGYSGEGFSQDETELHRSLEINEEGVYVSCTYVDGRKVDEVEPSIFGQTLDNVPIVTIGTNKLCNEILTSPVLGISDIAISIYQKEADMANAEFITCSPMLVLTGVDAEDAPSIIGSGVSYAIPSDTAKVFYVEPQSNCLSHLKERIIDLQQEAMMQGANLLGATKKSAESTETSRLRQEAAGSTLVSVVKTVGQGVEKALKIAAEWMGADPDKVAFSPNLDFSEMRLTAQEQTALLQSWMNGGISHGVYLHNLKEAGIIPEQMEIEEVMGEIETAAPNMMTGEQDGTTDTEA